MADLFCTTPYIYRWLIDNKGFKPIEYEVDWEVFGWAKLLNKTSWGTDRDETLDEITDYLNKRELK